MAVTDRFTAVLMVDIDCGCEVIVGALHDGGGGAPPPLPYTASMASMSHDCSVDPIVSLSKLTLTRCTFFNA